MVGSCDALGRCLCLFPGQVRRLGAFATSVTPRRAARVAPQDCAAGGGEYIEAQDTSGAATKVWYEKAAAQGMARAQLNLASLIDRGLGGPRNAARVAELLVAASGGVVAGLAYSSREQPRFEFVSPMAAAPLPRPRWWRMWWRLRV